MLLAVFAIAMLRNMFELLHKFGYIFGKQDLVSEYLSVYGIFLHFMSFWIFVWLLLSVVIFLFTKKENSIRNALKFTMFGMFIILFPVIFDLLIGNDDMMLYPNDPRDLFFNMEYYFHIEKKIFGLSPGMRYEVALVSFSSGIYIWLKSKKLIKSVIAISVVFLVISACGLWVSFFAQIYEYGFEFKSDFLFTTSKLFSESTILRHWTMGVSIVYILLIIILLIFIFHTDRKAEFRAVFSNLRWTRSIHYLILFFAGLALGHLNFLSQKGMEIHVYQIFKFINPFDYIGILAGAVSIFLAFQSAVIYNDYFDFKIDTVSNPDRPLVLGQISPQSYRKLGILMLIFALVLAFAVNLALFYFVLTASILSYVYSNEPFRLKKVFLINNLILGFIALTVFHAGASLLLNDRSFTQIPSILSYAILFGFTLVSVIKDIKDYEGDKQNGIKTLVTVFGLKNGKIISAILISLVIIALPIFIEIDFNVIFSLIFVLIFNILFFFVKDSEKYIFLTYFVYMIWVMSEYLSELSKNLM
jgi:4-hydroxybenzoate polyprenyltransferase